MAYAYAEEVVPFASVKDGNLAPIHTVAQVFKVFGFSMAATPSDPAAVSAGQRNRVGISIWHSSQPFDLTKWRAYIQAVLERPLTLKQIGLPEAIDWEDSSGVLLLDSETKQIYKNNKPWQSYQNNIS